MDLTICCAKLLMTDKLPAKKEACTMTQCEVINCWEAKWSVLRIQIAKQLTVASLCPLLWQSLWPTELTLMHQQLWQCAVPSSIC